jgi:hypothetical protein
MATGFILQGKELELGVKPESSITYAAKKKSSAGLLTRQKRR